MLCIGALHVFAFFAARLESSFQPSVIESSPDPSIPNVTSWAELVNVTSQIEPRSHMSRAVNITLSTTFHMGSYTGMIDFRWNLISLFKHHHSLLSFRSDKAFIIFGHGATFDAGLKGRFFTAGGGFYSSLELHNYGKNAQFDSHICDAEREK
jgi:hypothetical protein